MLHETVLIGSEGGGSRNWLGQVVDETAKPVTFVPPPPSCQVTTPVGPALPTGVVTWHDGGGGTNVTGFAVSSTTWPSQFLLPPPSLPMKTVSWSISHIKLQLQGTGSGTIIVQVYSASATQQPATLLDLSLI